LPQTARLYFRKSQLPEGETFRKKTAVGSRREGNGLSFRAGKTTRKIV
jgi:hypothetical protein